MMSKVTITDPMLPPITDHHDGGGLNELLRIERDARDHEHGGGASHYYELVLDVAPAEEEWMNTRAERPCPHCTSEEHFQCAGMWLRCLACGTTWDPERDEYHSSIVGTLQFQHGPRTEPDSTPGLLDGALIAVLLDRYRGFQAGSFACEDNAKVIGHLEDALLRMQRRVRLRQAQDVLGRNAAHEEPR